MLLEFIEGVLDSVLVEGDCSGDSLKGLCSSGGENAKAFSLPVIASDIALRPVARDLGAVVLWIVGDGAALSIEDVSLSGLLLRGDPAIVSILGTPNSRLVTMGDPGEAGDQDFPIWGPLVALDPDLPKYELAANEWVALPDSCTESVLPARLCLNKPLSLRELYPSLGTRPWYFGLSPDFFFNVFLLRTSASFPEKYPRSRSIELTIVSPTSCGKEAKSVSIVVDNGLGAGSKIDDVASVGE